MRGKYIQVRYIVHLIAFYMISSGVFSFAATYLMEKGFHAGQVGIILSVTNLVSCFAQPALASVVDRISRFALPYFFAGSSILAFFCFVSIQILQPPILVFSILYAGGCLSITIVSPLINALCVYYTNKKRKLSYAFGCGVGSLSYSVSSLGFGYIIKALGADWMIWSVLILLGIEFIAVIGYPNLDGEESAPVQACTKGDQVQETGISMLTFLMRYRWFIIALAGVIAVAMCHSMAENYLISVIQKLGGNSSHVGIAMFAATFVAAPFMMLFEKIRKFMVPTFLMRMAGFIYVAKALFLIVAPNIGSVYVIQLLQIVTYASLYPSLYYFTESRIGMEDMVKGQALAVASFTLGTALGSLVGGQVIDRAGLTQMLLTAAVLAAIGSVILLIAIPKSKNVKQDRKSMIR